MRNTSALTSQPGHPLKKAPVATLANICLVLARWRSLSRAQTKPPSDKQHVCVAAHSQNPTGVARCWGAFEARVSSEQDENFALPLQPVVLPPLNDHDCGGRAGDASMNAHFCRIPGRNWVDLRH